MYEPTSGEGHELLNPFGKVIHVSKITLCMLDMRGYLQRDRASGLKQFKPRLVALFLRLERSTYHRELYAALGPDFSGPAVVLCPCRECDNKIADLEHTRLSEEYGRQMVKAVHNRKRAA